MVHTIKDFSPTIHPSVFIAWNAEVAGNVCLEENCSVWFSATVRGDLSAICIGAGSNVQDNAVIHTDFDCPCLIGKNVTIGHSVILHSCTIEDNATIGMGAIILNGAHIGKNSMVGAGSLVTQGKKFPDKSLILGSPAKYIRALTQEEIESMSKNITTYIIHAQEAKNEYKNPR